MYKTEGFMVVNCQKPTHSFIRSVGGSVFKECNIGRVPLEVWEAWKKENQAKRSDRKKERMKERRVSMVKVRPRRLKRQSDRGYLIFRNLFDSLFDCLHMGRRLLLPM